MSQRVYGISISNSNSGFKFEGLLAKVVQVLGFITY
jgi:hypothetical protein